MNSIESQMNDLNISNDEIMIEIEESNKQYNASQVDDNNKDFDSSSSYDYDDYGTYDFSKSKSLLEDDNMPILFIGDKPPKLEGDKNYVQDLEYMMSYDPSVAYEMNQESKLDESLQLEAKSDNAAVNREIKSPQNGSNSQNTTKKPKAKKKVGRKPLGLGLVKRKDVVYKSVLRQIRNYFWTGLNDHTKYQARKSRRDESFYYECLDDYISKALKVEVSDQIILLVGSFASPRDMEALIKKDPYKIYPKSKIEKCRSIHKTLYLFNQKRFEKEILKSSDMCQLILDYFNRPDYHHKDNDERIIGDLICKECRKNI